MVYRRGCNEQHQEELSPVGQTFADPERRKQGKQRVPPLSIHQAKYPMNQISKDSKLPTRHSRFRFRISHLMLLTVAVAVVAPLLYQHWNNAGHADWMRASPFTDVQVKGDTVLVEFNKVRYELVS